MRKDARNQRENETKVVCPKCGAEFAIAEKTHVTIGIAIGKDAGLGTIHPQVVGQDKPAAVQPKLPGKADERIAALKAHGIDVSGFYSMKGADGGEYVGRLEDGKMSIVADDDPIYNAILNDGDVYNWKLARRWVMSQMFHMLAREGGMVCREYKNSITEQIRRMGYEYMWKQMEDELYAQMKMYKNGDMENFKDRNHWFNKGVLVAMIEDYRYQLHLHVKHRVKVQKCKGVPYKRICGENVFVEDIKNKVFRPIEAFKERAAGARNAAQLYAVVHEFNKIRKARSWNPRQCAVWIDAYKGAGAFFTMQNLIRYHKCGFEVSSGYVMNKEASYVHLKAKAAEYEGEGWKMIGLMRQFLEDNDIDIVKKMAEWRKK